MVLPVAASTRYVRFTVQLCYWHGLQWNEYHGVWCSAFEQGFIDSRWMIYKQTKAEGRQVLKEEYGNSAMFYSTLERENDDGEAQYKC